MAEPTPPSVCADVGPKLLDPGAVVDPGGAVDAAAFVPVAEDSSYSSCAKDIYNLQGRLENTTKAKTSQKEMTLKYHVRSYSFKVNNQPMSKESTEVHPNHTPQQLAPADSPRSCW